MSLGTHSYPSGEHLVQQRSQTPPIHRLSVARAIQDLRSQVLRSSAERLRASVSLRDALLAQSEVGESHVALLGQKDVFGLQIARVEEERQRYR